jgi:branched-chain amino acid transport system substrate-binding protein
MRRHKTAGCWRFATALCGLTVLLPMGAAPVQAEDTLRFGASLSLTGSLSTEGKRVKDGYDFYVKHINDQGGIDLCGKKYKMEVKYYDDESQANTAVRLVEKLITEDGIKFLLGPYGSGATLAASTVAEQHQVPMVIAHGASTPIYERGYKYIFAVLNTVDQYTQPIIDMAAYQEPRPKTVALINENALFPQLGINAAAGQAKEKGFDVVYQEKYPSGTKDLSSLLAAAKAKNPDMFIAGGYTGDMILLAKQAHEAGFRPKLLAFLLGPTLPGFVESLKQDADYVLEPVQWAPSMPWKDQFLGWTAEQFAQTFQKEFGYWPDYHPPQSAAAVEVYQAAMQKACDLDPKKVRDAIAQTEIMTFYGPIKFNGKGVNIAKPMAVVQIQNGKPIVVWPQEAAQGKLIYPIPGR